MNIERAESVATGDVDVDFRGRKVLKSKDVTFYEGELGGLSKLECKSEGSSSDETSWILRKTKVMSAVNQEKDGQPIATRGVIEDIADLDNDLAETETNEVAGASSEGQEDPTKDEPALQRSC